MARHQTRWTESPDEESDSYQRRTPTASRRIARAIRHGIDVAMRDMERILRAWQYRGGFQTPQEARQWLNHPTGDESLTDLRKRADSLSEPQRSHVLLEIDRRAYAYRFNRRKVLEEYLKVHAHSITENILTTANPILLDVAYESYARAEYGLQKSANVMYSLNTIPTDLLNEAVNSQMPYSRIFESVRGFTEPVRQQVINGIMAGEDIHAIARGIAPITRTAPWKAKAIARTVITEVTNDTNKRTSQEYGLKRYRYVANLDEKTCPICGKLDGQVFSYEDAQKGVNFPPMHPNCRCHHQVALTDEAMSRIQRAGRDKDGRYARFPASMTYEQWARENLPRNKR